MPSRSDARAALAAVLLVAVAAAAGLAVGARARPAPRTVAPAVTSIAIPSATPLDQAAVERRAFAQPLAAGCATGRAVWLFADGGTVARFDGGTWQVPDPSLRSLAAAACTDGAALAVGRGGSILTADDDLRELRADQTGAEDLHALALLPREGAIAVGSRGTVLRQGQLGWTPFAPDVEEDLFGVAIAGQPSATGGRTQAWIVGAAGTSFRLTERGWERSRTGTTATLRAVVMVGAGAIAVGDRGTVLRSTDAGGWAAAPAGTDADLLAVAPLGASIAWAVGGRGTVVEISGDRARAVDLGTTCTLRAVFREGSAVWVVGSDGDRGEAWRIAPTGTQRWGAC